MKKTFACAASLVFTLLFPINGYAATPIATYSFDGDTGDATPVERVEYYSDNGIVPSEGDTFTYTEGKLGQCLHMDGYEALNLNVSMSSESYTVSYWIKPDKIVNCTPTLMITPWGFQADTFINVTLSVGNISPNIWTHMLTPYEERSDTGLPGLLSANEWSYVTIVADENMSPALLDEYGVALDEYNTGVALYINGFLIDIGKVPKGLCVDSTSFWFGINIWDDLYMGYVDQLSVFDSALDNDSIKELYLSAGGDPDAKAPVGSTHQNKDEFPDRPGDGSFSSDFVEIEQGTISGNNMHLNLDNASPLTTQGVDTTTDAYADVAAIVGFSFIILSAGLFMQHIKQKRNSYN